VEDERRPRRKPRKAIGERIREASEGMDVPGQLLPGFYHVELVQNRQAVVDGVKGVLSYSETQIQLNLQAVVVTFKGAGLSIRSYQTEQLILTGTIAEVHFTA
jgi:sporulation protein YqfC